MGRPKDFPVIFDDLVVKYKSKSMADKEYKAYMVLAKEQGLDKNAKLTDVNATDLKLEDSTFKRSGGVVEHSDKKKQKGMFCTALTAGSTVTSNEKVMTSSPSPPWLQLTSPSARHQSPTSVRRSTLRNAVSHRTARPVPRRNTTRMQELVLVPLVV